LKTNEIFLEIFCPQTIFSFSKSLEKDTMSGKRPNFECNFLKLLVIWQNRRAKTEPEHVCKAESEILKLGVELELDCRCCLVAVFFEATEKDVSSG
jgi:hypothetical protein